MSIVVARVSSPALIGRGHELDRVAAGLAAARQGHPAFYLVAGEAGVGKTRFLREVADRARANGWRVLEGGCVPVGAEGLPYGPLVEALRGLSYDLSPADLDELLGSGRAEWSSLMPHLFRDRDGAPVGGPPDSSAQGRLFEHLLLFLERRGANAADSCRRGHSLGRPVHPRVARISGAQSAARSNRHCGVISIG